MTTIITEISPKWTPRELKFLASIDRFLARGGTYKAVISMIDAITSTDRVAAYQQLLADVVNPIDRELYEVGLIVVQGGDV